MTVDAVCKMCWKAVKHRARVLKKDTLSRKLDGRAPVHKDTSLEKVLALIEKEMTENSQFIICFRKP